MYLIFIYSLFICIIHVLKDLKNTYFSGACGQLSAV